MVGENQCHECSPANGKNSGRPARLCHICAELRQDSVLIINQSAFDKALYLWGGWGSNPRPRDYE
jgi:hypothetical protein